jgi:hypothetical protein
MLLCTVDRWVHSDKAMSFHARPARHRQLDLFAWKPKPREPHQLNLFGDPDPVP